MNICLFALTGFGNDVLASLLTIKRLKNIVVVTRKEKQPFPYYPCEHLEKLCKRNNIKVCFDDNLSSKKVFKEIELLRPDLILIATFHKKIPSSIINLSKKGAINIHPSLLPKYGGANPTNWAIINGEKISGITFHIANEKFDDGAVLMQKAVSIKRLNDGKLRKKLSKLAGKTVKQFVENYMVSIPKTIKQNMLHKSYYPKISSNEAIDILRCNKFAKSDILRGLSPYPGVTLLKKP